MKQLPSALLAAVLVLTAAPAAAQTRDPSTNTALAILDECLSGLKGEASFDAAMSRRGFQRASNGGWVNRVGSAVISASTGTNLIRGAQAKLCSITMVPQTTDSAGLDAAIAARARPWSLQYISPGPATAAARSGAGPISTGPA